MTAASSPGAVFAAGVAEGVLRYQRCDDCARAVFYPRVLCPFCGSEQLRWHNSAGRGAVYANTWVAGRTGGHSVALVDLDEGFRMMSSVTAAAPEAVRTGMRVVGQVDTAGDEPRVVFRPETDQA